MDGLNGLSDGGGGEAKQESGGAVLLREEREEAEEDGETEPEAEEQEDQEETDNDPAPPTMLGRVSTPDKGVQGKISASLRNSCNEGGQRSVQVPRETREVVGASPPCFEAASAPGVAEIVVQTETGPVSPKPQPSSQQQQETAPRCPIPSTDSDEDNNKQKQDFGDPAKVEEEDEQPCLLGVFKSTAAPLPTVDCEKNTAAPDGGSGGRGNSALFGHDGSDDIEDSDGGAQGQQRTDTVSNKDYGMTDEFDSQCDGNPDVQSSSCGNVSHNKTGPLPPPSLSGSGNDAAGVRVSSQGAAAALDCHWLPITLPQTTPSRLEVEPKNRTESLDPALPAGRRGSTLSPVVEMEALESPQESSILRKTDGNPRGK